MPKASLKQVLSRSFQLCDRMIKLVDLYITRRKHPLEPATVAPIAAPSTDSDDGGSAASERAASDSFQLVDDRALLAEPPGEAEWVEVVPEPEFEVRVCNSVSKVSTSTLWLRSHSG